MDYGALLTDTKWNLITELARKNQTPTDLAKKANTSLANITQQLKLLEAYGLVKKKRRINSNEPGKPKTEYSIGKEIIHLTYINQDNTEKKELDLDIIQKAIINLWLNIKKEDIYFIEKCFILNEELLKKCQAVALVKTTPEQIELLMITHDVHHIREKYSNLIITNLEDKKRKIVFWTHSIEEIETGLKHNEKYFLDLTANMKTFLDKENLTDKIKAIKNGKDN